MTIKKKKTRNKFERKLETSLKRARVQYSYESDKFAYILARHYIPDFTLITPLGKIYIEAKGYLRPEDKSKMRAVKQQNPDKDIRIVFQVERPAYIKWAEKNGFRWSIGTIPKEWMKGL